MFGLDTQALSLGGKTLLFSFVGETLALSLGGDTGGLRFGGLALAVKFCLTCGLCLGTTGRNLLARHIVGHQSATTGCGTTLSQIGLAVWNNLIRLQNRQFVTRGNTPSAIAILAALVEA